MGTNRSLFDEKVEMDIQQKTITHTKTEAGLEDRGY